MSAESHHEHQFNAFLLGMLATLASVMTAITLFNWNVDPYRLFSAVGHAEPSSIKVRPEANVAPVKLLNAIATRPDVLVLGNSRADVGFDPRNAAVLTLGTRPYNLAVPGQSIIEQTRAFVSVLESSPVRVAVVGLDFQDFVLNAGYSPQDAARDVVDTEELRRLEQAKALFTMSGTRDSLQTLRLSQQKYPRTLRDDGFNPMLDYVGIAARSGYQVMFAQRLRETAGSYSRARLGLFPSDAQDSAQFAAFRRLLRTARQRDVRLVLLTYPYHAEYLVLFRELGLWPAFEQWKRLLLQTIELEAKDTAGAWQVELWDFAAFSSYSTLPIARLPEHGAGTWYWEAGHFKKELGDVVLGRVLQSPAGSAADPDLGVELNGQNIDDWLADQSAAATTFARDNPELVREVRRAIGSDATAQL